MSARAASERRQGRGAANQGRFSSSRVLCFLFVGAFGDPDYSAPGRSRSFLRRTAVTNLARAVLDVEAAHVAVPCRGQPVGGGVGTEQWGATIDEAQGRSRGCVADVLDAQIGSTFRSPTSRRCRADCSDRAAAAPGRGHRPRPSGRRLAGSSSCFEAHFGGDVEDAEDADGAVDQQAPPSDRPSTKLAPGAGCSPRSRSRRLLKKLPRPPSPAAAPDRGPGAGAHHVAVGGFVETEGCPVEGSSGSLGCPPVPAQADRPRGQQQRQGATPHGGRIRCAVLHGFFRRRPGRLPFLSLFGSTAALAGANRPRPCRT